MLRARMLSSAAKHMARAERERKRKRDDDSQEGTQPSVRRRASGEEAQPDPELKDVGESGSFAVAAATKTFVAPPGLLGLLIDNSAESNTKGTAVSDVLPSSVLVDKISPGDRIIAIDGDDVSLMTNSEVHAIMVGKSDLERQLTVCVPSHDQQFEFAPALAGIRQGQAPTLSHSDEPSMLTERSNQQQPKPTPDPASINTKGDQVEGRPPAMSPTSIEYSTLNPTMNATSPMNDTSPPVMEKQPDIRPEGQPPIDMNQPVEQESHADVSLKIGIIMAGKSDLERQLTVRVPSPDRQFEFPLALAEIRQGQVPTSRHPVEQSMSTEQSNQQQPKPTPDPAPINTKGDHVEGRPSAISPTSVELSTLNPTMTATSPVNDTSPPATEKQQDIIAEGQPPIDMNQPVEEESHAMMPWTGVRGWLLLLVSLAIFIALRPVLGRSRQMTSASTLKLVLPPCFLSSTREESEDKGSVFGWCDNSKGPDPCPHGGICSEGELRSCMGSYHRVSESGDQCVLSAASNKTLASVEAILAEWTAKHYCALTGHGWGTIVDVSAPSFELSHLVENVNTVTPLLLTSNSFDVRSEKDGMIIIGLTEGHIQARSVIPCSCRFRISVIQFLEYIEKPMLRAMFYVWFIFKSRPLASVLFLCHAGCLWLSALASETSKLVT